MKGRGHAVAGRNYDEYQLNDFSGWLRHYVENTKHWNKIKSYLSSSKMCSRLDQRYPGAQYLFNAHLTPLETFRGAVRNFLGEFRSVCIMLSGWPFLLVEIVTVRTVSNQKQ